MMYSVVPTCRSAKEVRFPFGFTLVECYCNGNCPSVKHQKTCNELGSDS